MKDEGLVSLGPNKPSFSTLKHHNLLSALSEVRFVPAFKDPNSYAYGAAF